MSCKIIEFLKWIWRGKSARRAFLNMEVAKCIGLKGMILDVGGKGGPSYHEVLQGLERICWVVMDIFPSEHVSVCGDLTSSPFKDELFDAAVCFNVLEHVYDYRAALNEIYRVLKADGVLYGYVPFICNVHPDPADYWRFTDDCLRRCLSEAGYTPNSIVSHGGVFLSCFDLASFTVKKIPPLRLLMAALLFLADRIMKRIRPLVGGRFPVGYFFIGRKTGVTDKNAGLMV
jgi:SAM-dependent methyltransferase